MERKYNMLVSFAKYKEDTEVNTIEQIYEKIEKEETEDIQYHYFKNCSSRTGFMYDPIYRAFRNKGYLWSAIEFPEELANKCMFTESECKRR